MNAEQPMYILSEEVIRSDRMYRFITKGIEKHFGTAFTFNQRHFDFFEREYGMTMYFNWKNRVVISFPNEEDYLIFKLKYL